MNIKSLSFTILKLLSVYVFAESFIPGVFSFLSYFSQDYREFQTIVIIQFAGFAIAMLLISIILWFGADRLSSRISDSYSFEETISNEKRLKESRIIEIGLILIGFYMIFLRLPSLFSQIAGIIEYGSFDLFKENKSLLYNFLESIIAIIIGIALIIGKRLLVIWVLKLKTLGLRPSV